MPCFSHPEDFDDDGDEEMDKDSDVEVVKEVGQRALGCNNIHADTVQKKGRLPYVYWTYPNDSDVWKAQILLLIFQMSFSSRCI